MTGDRLPTELWLRAHMRRLTLEAIPVAVVHRGEAMGGTVLLKLNQLDLGCRVLTQARGPDGALGCSLRNDTRTPMSGRTRGSFCLRPTRTLTVALVRSAVGMMAMTSDGISQSG